MGKPVAGFYELVGQPQVGKTTLAALIAREYEDVLWIWAAQEVSEGVLAAVGLVPAIKIVATIVGAAFGVLKEVQGYVDFAVLDTLAGLEPNHPSATRIAPSVNRNLFEPKVPILVINQDRYPAPPGGAVWAAIVQRRRLSLFRDRPYLMSHLEGGQWLVWDDDGPRYGSLGESDEIWMSEEVINEFSRDSRSPRQRQWLC